MFTYKAIDLDVFTMNVSFIALQSSKNVRIGLDTFNTTFKYDTANFALLSYYHLRSFYKIAGKHYDNN